MVDLRDLLSALEFKNVQTYIQRGNIILDADKSKSEVCQIIKEGVLSKFGYDVPVLARTIPEWENLISKYPFSIENEKIVAFSFLNKGTKESLIEMKNIGED